MSRGTNCVVIYSIVMIILFIVFCYLMTTVNPPPLKIEHSDDGLNEAVVKLENIIFDEVLLPPLDNTLYGREKADIELTGEHATIKPNRRMPIIMRNSSAIFNFTTRRARPPIWITTALINSTREYINNIIIDDSTDSTVNALNTETITIPNNVSTEETEANTVTVDTPIKGRRRSVIDFESHTNDKLDSVVLYIIDDSGQLKFEIKLASNDLSKNDNESLKHKIESTFSIGVLKNNGDLFNISKLAKNCSIQVLPNNTAIIDDFEGVDFGEERDLLNCSNDDTINKTAINIDNVYKAPLGNTTAQVKDYEDVFLELQNELNKTKAIPIHTEMYALKIMFDNETKSITNNVNENIIDANLTEPQENITEEFNIHNNSATPDI